MATYLHTLDRYGTCGLVDGSYVCPYHAVVTLDELDIYGSSRLGTYEPAQNLITKYDVMLGYKEFKVPVYDTVTNIGNLTIPETDTFSTHLGQKKYELTDHLGNVLTTISDRKLEIAYNDTLTNFTMPDVVASQDYYAFGMQMPGRIYQSDNYRFGFNGKEQDDDMKGEGNSLDFGARIYDSRLGRWLSIDPYQREYPNNSPYSYALNNSLRYEDKGGKFVKDANGNIIVTITNPTGAYKIGGSGYNIDGSFKSETYEIIGQWGKILTDKGDEVTVFIATSDNVFIEIGSVSPGGEIVEGYGMLGNPSDYEVHYNCTSNGLANRSLVISADQITPKVLSDEEYSEFTDVSSAKTGDVGIYRPGGGEEISHFEPFISSDKVLSKGGIAKDEGAKKPGENPSFIGGATYSVLRKGSPDVKIYPQNFVGPVEPNAIRSDIITPGATSGASNQVDAATFDAIKKEVQKK